MSKLKKLFSHISKYGHFRELDNPERDFFFFFFCDFFFLKIGMEKKFKKYRKENCEQSQTNKE